MNFNAIALLLPLAAGNPTVPIPPVRPAPGCAVTGCPVPRLMKPDACMPEGPPAPLLAAKLIAPAGVRATFHPGTPGAKAFVEPVVVGFRPGYCYRVELSGLPGRSGQSLYPEIEVLGSLVPRPGMKYMDYPAAVVFSPTDIERAAGGAMVTKVIFLEDPDWAVPVQTTPDRPYEAAAPSEEAAILHALDAGRLVMIVRLGDRKPDDIELKQAAIPGTILFPGENRLAAPPVPPRLPFCGIPLYDPLLGPKFPAEECIPDGNDVGPRLGIGPGGRLGGLNPTDLAAEYTQANRRRVTTSNRVCVCVPRFVVQRVEVLPGGLQLASRAETVAQAYNTASMLTRTAAQAVYARFKPAGFEERIRPQVQIGREGIHVLVAPWTKASAVAVSNGVKVIATAVAPEEATNLDGFVVTKTAEPSVGVKIGDEVTITIRYTNHTRLPVSEVVVSDSLSARFSYVPGSSESDRPANVTTELNEAGSAIVRFELPGTVQPGQGGVVRFKVRVR
jgi:uncharacterized repeat protein (TIGR01451 family)